MTEELFEYADDAEQAYSPLDDFEDADEEEESDGQLGPAQISNRPAYRKPVEDTRPTSERIASLFQKMEPRKRVLRAILNFLDTPKRTDVLATEIEELQRYDYSVYDAYSYTELLAAAGAVNKVMEDGSPVPEDYEQAPDIVVVDGVEFYKPTDGPMFYWVSTDDARAFLALDNPEARMEALLQDQIIYAHVYQRVLDAAASPAGASAKVVEDLVDNDPICAEPRRWSAFFTKRLEDCEAIRWAGSWQITDIGRKAQAILTDIIADAEGK